MKKLLFTILLVLSQAQVSLGGGAPLEGNELTPAHILMSAAQSGDLERLTHIIEDGADMYLEGYHGDDISDDYRGRTPLHIASQYGHDNVVSFLLEKGANPFATTSNDGRNALHIATRENKINVARLLLEQGKAHNPYDDKQVSYENIATYQGIHGKIPLHLAAERTGPDFVKLLIKANPEGLNTQDQQGWTPLHYAAEKGNFPNVLLLLDSGADSSIVNNDGRTPLHYAAGNRSYQTQAVAKLLIENNPEIVEIKGNHGKLPLHLAAEKGGMSTVAILLKANKESMNAQDGKGMTPLHYAIQNGNVTNTALLIRCGASTIIPNNDGITARDFPTRSIQIRGLQEKLRAVKQLNL